MAARLGERSKLTHLRGSEGPQWVDVLDGNAWKGAEFKAGVWSMGSLIATGYD